MDVSLIVSVASFAIVVIVAVVFVFVLRGRAGPMQQPDGAIRVPLRAAYGWRKGLAPLGSHNNFNPLLLLHDDRIEYRVLKRTSAPYATIASVDAVTGWGRAAVILAFTDSAFVFSGNTGGKAALAEALRLLRDKGCALSDRAKAIADAPA